MYLMENHSNLDHLLKIRQQLSNLSLHEGTKTKLLLNRMASRLTLLAVFGRSTNPEAIYDPTCWASLDLTN